jgi:Xaa-Pro aminopeptidase
MNDIKSIGANWTPDRLTAIRHALTKSKFDGFVIPRWDCHQFEYVTPRDERLAWTTGFTGSWGLAIVTTDRAVIFVDSRYTEQAAREVSSEHFDLEHLYDAPPETWLLRKLEPGQTIGYDPAVASPALVNDLRTAAERRNAYIEPLWKNPVDTAWTDRPTNPLSPAEAFPISLAGKTSNEKLRELAGLLEENDLDFLVATVPDNINWLFNLRGSDLEYCPVTHARAIIHRNGHVDLFLERNKLAANAKYEFLENDNHIQRHEPDTFFTIMADRLHPGMRIGTDPRFSPAGVIDIATSAGANPVLLEDPLTALKAVKNATELETQRSVTLRDSAIWCQFAKWLEETVPARDDAGNPVTELEAETYIDDLRQAENDFYGSSFRTISASDVNGVLAHYAAPPEGSAPITRQSVYLHDSGALFKAGGTTDTTRCFCFAPPAEALKTHYTSVLKGHIALAGQLFPVGTTGHQLDAFARAPLWNIGLDYAHGTGHGVGHFLSVHEHPQRLQKSASHAPLQAGMTITVEPGYYEPGKYGIRIENLYEIIKSNKPGFLTMRPLAYTPIQTNMINVNMLTKKERLWLDEYHRATYEKIAPLLADTETLLWLKQATKPLI